MKSHFLIQVDDSSVNGSSVMGGLCDMLVCLLGPWECSLKGYAKISVHLHVPVLTKFRQVV